MSESAGPKINYWSAHHISTESAISSPTEYSARLGILDKQTDWRFNDLHNVLQDTINDNEILRCYFFSVFVNKWNNSFVTECHLTIYPCRKLCAGFTTSLRWHKTTAIIQNHMTIVRPCDRSNLNTSDSGAELAE